MMATARSYEATKRGRLAGDDLARLFARAADGDQVAWSALVNEFSQLVSGATRAYRLNDADAADVVQSTWMRLLQSLDHINDPTRLSAWLTTTARRESVHVLRRAARLIPSGNNLSDPPSDTPHHDARLITQENAAALRVALKHLKPRDDALLRMLAAEPTPNYQEISAVLGLAVGSIGPTRARALARLRREAARAGLTAEAASGTAA
jgi:RNA polymerase sigma factor (sigma-70 family)